MARVERAVRASQMSKGWQSSDNSSKVGRKGCKSATRLRLQCEGFRSWRRRRWVSKEIGATEGDRCQTGGFGIVGSLSKSYYFAYINNNCLVWLIVLFDCLRYLIALFNWLYFIVLFDWLYWLVDNHCIVFLINVLFSVFLRQSQSNTHCAIRSNTS